MTLRLIGLSAMLSIAAVPIPAVAWVGAQPSVESPSGDIQVVVASKGVSRFPAECATFKVSVKGTGPTVAEARSQTRAIVDQLTQELINIGIPRANLGVEESATLAGFIGNEALAAELPAEVQAAMAQRPKSVTSTMVVSVMEISLLPRVQRLLRDRDSVYVEGPQYALKDERPARRTAIADAVSRARTDAEAYASALGLKVVRVQKVRDLAAETPLTQSYEEMFERMVRRSSVNPSTVETSVRVAVEFVMTSR